METIKLETLRSSLIRQEETIIFALIERAQFFQNLAIYKPGSIPIEDFSGSFSDYLLWETEKIHARVRRYSSPDEHAFFENLPASILPELKIPKLIKQTSINVNRKIQEIYKNHIIPIICQEGDDQNYGSSATCDVTCLQALSKRIHFGKFVAEAKFQENPKKIENLVEKNDSKGLLEVITNREVEHKLLNRVEQKAATYGQEIGCDLKTQEFKIAPKTVSKVYEQWLIPLTKEVEIMYLQVRPEG